MEGLVGFLFDTKVREGVVAILEVLATALKDGLDEGEALQALNDIAKIVIDLLLPGQDAVVEVNLRRNT